MKKKSLRKIILALFLLLSIASISIFYINKFVLPVKIKSLIIRHLEKETRKKVTLESVQFNILKGLILRNLSVWDGQKKLIGFKEASFSFLILPVLRERKIIIPNVRIQEPVIFLERESGGSFNLRELMPKPKNAAGHPEFGLIISALNLTAGHIDFQDNAVSPPFTKSLADVNLNIFFSLPASLRFEVNAKIPSALPLSLNADGQFLLTKQELKAKIAIRNASVSDFSPYYKGLTFDIKGGLIDAFAQLNLKEGLLTLDSRLQGRDIASAKDKAFLSLNADASSLLKYNTKDKRLTFSGKADIFKANISGVDTLGEIKDINGRINFNDSGLSSDRILATVFGFPIEAKINLVDFKNPSLTIEAASKLSLSDLQKIGLEKLKVSLPAEITGEGRLLLNVTAKPASQEAPLVNGSLNISSAAVKIDKISSPITDIHGLLSFDMTKLNWSNLRFKFQESAYQSEGELIDFNNPAVSLRLSSPELSLTSRFSFTENKLIKIAELKGKYLNTSFLLSGNLGIADTQSISASLNIDADINLEDTDKPLHKFKERLEQIKPSGLVKAKINLQGSLNHPKLCTIKAEASSPSLSLYGLKSDEFILRYEQSQGIADIPLIRIALYNGVIEANAKVNLDTENMPFRIETKIEDINIGKLKDDTPARNQDISGTLQAVSRLNGFIGDYSKLSGSGQILVKDGKLWELNLFKGMGKLIFSRNFADITFSKGYCEFFVKDRSVFTENLTMVSPLVSLEGKCKIGFDGSLSAAMNVQLSEETMPETGTFKDFTTALMGVPGRFAVIDISGSLQKPEFKFKTAMLEVIKGITGSVIENIFGQ
ncbi:DUF748 domain-containing protein [bacterium]|nr:MAG: DUF748 domain-containing protein [bacterium]